MIRARAWAAAVPPAVWTAVAGLVLLASVGLALVVGAGLTVWRGAISGAGKPPSVVVSPPRSGLVVVPAAPLPRPHPPVVPASPGQSAGRPVAVVVVPPARQPADTRGPARPPVVVPPAVVPPAVSPATVPPPPAPNPSVTPPTVRPGSVVVAALEQSLARFLAASGARRTAAGETFLRLLVSSDTASRLAARPLVVRPLTSVELVRGLAEADRDRVTQVSARPVVAVHVVDSVPRQGIRQLFEAGRGRHRGHATVSRSHGRHAATEAHGRHRANGEHHGRHRGHLDGHHHHGH
jgi:hypothetical protein